VLDALLDVSLHGKHGRSFRERLIVRMVMPRFGARERLVEVTIAQVHAPRSRPRENRDCTAQLRVV
jgi:hypothetical protein